MYSSCSLELLSSEEKVKDVNELIKELEEERDKLIYELCNDNKLYAAEIILHTVYQIRSITQLLRFIKN